MRERFRIRRVPFKSPEKYFDSHDHDIEGDQGYFHNSLHGANEMYSLGSDWLLLPKASMLLSRGDFREETSFIENADGVEAEDDRLHQRVQRQTHDDYDDGVVVINKSW